MLLVHGDRWFTCCIPVRYATCANHLPGTPHAIHVQPPQAYARHSRRSNGAHDASTQPQLYKMPIRARPGVFARWPLPTSLTQSTTFTGKPPHNRSTSAIHSYTCQSTSTDTKTNTVYIFQIISAPHLQFLLRLCKALKLNGFCRCWRCGNTCVSHCNCCHRGSSGAGSPPQELPGTT